MFTQPYRPMTYSMGQSTYPSHTGGTGYPQHGGGTVMPPQVPSGSPMTPGGTVMPTPIPQYEQSYIENIFRLNLGKVGTFYMTYENNSEWNAKVFKGVLEAAGRDHIIISDPATGVRTVMLMVNFDYATFDEPLVYQYPGTIGAPPMRR
ncbi:spore coat protein GerQ [Paenibacillus macerans]|uniref:spore coat protein GerQ n=1 Tax=Paenibacillus macerans TaxID=44252 RepID=UPI003D32399D